MLFKRYQHLSERMDPCKEKAACERLQAHWARVWCSAFHAINKCLRGSLVICLYPSLYVAIPRSICKRLDFDKLEPAILHRTVSQASVSSQLVVLGPFDEVVLGIAGRDRFFCQGKFVTSDVEVAVLN